MDAFEGLFSRCHQAFKQSRTLARALDLAYGKMNCLGKHTVTGMITACGQQFKDWSASYRLFDGDRMDIGAFFSVIRKEVIDEHRFSTLFVGCIYEPYTVSLGLTFSQLSKKYRIFEPKDRDLTSLPSETCQLKSLEINLTRFPAAYLID